MFEAIPFALKQRNQWIVWRNVWLADKKKFTKQPLSPFTGQLASVTDAANHASFDHVAAILAQHHAPGRVDGLGFVFVAGSGVVGIDLDKVLDDTGRIVDYRAENIARHFNSYTEISPSGRGLHVIVEGSLVGGFRRENVEIYGSGRFFTMTGNSYGTPLPLAERQEYINVLVAEMQAAQNNNKVLDWTIPAKDTDANIWTMARNAANGEKFFKLWNGMWQEYYVSQSEADYALIDILAFYTDSPTQVRDLFMQSALGQRDKASRVGYISGMVQRSFDRKVPLVSIPALENPPAIPSSAASSTTSPAIKAEADPIPLDTEESEEKAALDDNPYSLPPGLVGEIARWTWLQSRWPMEELCLITGLAMIAGICGRQYQFNGSGLNLYMIFLAGTGAGKEALSQAMGKIFDAVIMPPRDVFVEPGKPAPVGFPAAAGFQGVTSLTGKGLLRFFNESATMSAVSVVPEFSQTMSQMADPRAHTGLREFQQTLLDFYMKSSDGTRYAGAMNSDKNSDIKALSSPSFTLVCEGTPERFWRAMTEHMVTDGLMSRFIVFERHGYNMNRNTACEANTAVPSDIKERITYLCDLVLRMKQANDTRLQVKIDPTAEAYSSELENTYRVKGVTGGTEIHKVLWLRAHQNIMRIAALVAIGVNMQSPVITRECIEWADRIIRRQVVTLAGKFRRGEIGVNNENERQQYEMLRDQLEKWLISKPEQYRKQVYHEARMAGVVPLQYLSERMMQKACFRQARNGATTALSQAVRHLESIGVLRRCVLPGRDGAFFTIEL